MTSCAASPVRLLTMNRAEFNGRFGTPELDGVLCGYTLELDTRTPAPALPRRHTLAGATLGPENQRESQECFFPPFTYRPRLGDDTMPDELNRRDFMENSGKLAAGTAGAAAWSALHPAVRVARGEMVAPSEKHPDRAHWLRRHGQLRSRRLHAPGSFRGRALRRRSAAP